MSNIVLGVTGSVATIKVKKLYKSLCSLGKVKIVATENAKHFIPKDLKFISDKDEWKSWKKMGDPVLHIELRKKASILVIAPLDANTLSKMALGLCDNLLTSLIRAWDYSKPMIIAPAMNTAMWTNSPTSEHLDLLKKRGIIVIDPIEKKLACQDVGIGAMASIEEITETVKAVQK